MDSSQQRIIAFFIAIVMLLLWKQQVWDPTFGSQPSLVTPKPPSKGLTTGDQTFEPQAKFLDSKKTELSHSKKIDYSFTKSLKVTNDFFTLAIHPLGGRLESVKLTNYKDNSKNGNPLDLVKLPKGSSFPLAWSSGHLSDREVVYSVSAPERTKVTKDQTLKVMLKGRLSDNREIIREIKVTGNSPIIEVTVHTSTPSEDRSPMKLSWSTKIPEETGSAFARFSGSGIALFDGESVERISFGDLDKKKSENVQWISVGDRYFMTSLISSDNKIAKSEFSENSEVAQISLYGSETLVSALIYFGPKHYEILEILGMDLHRNVDLGWTAIFAAPLIKILHWLYNNILNNYGVSIVVLTILVKLMLFPLNSASFRTMKKMQVLQPEMKKIRENIKDRQEQQQQLMKLYKKYQLNPAGGCLPIIVQIPIFFGLYTALGVDVALRHAPFALWINDLSAPEELMIGGIGIPVMVILLVVSMIAQQMMTPSQMDPLQKKIMLVVPLIFGVMFVGFPAGLTLYWLTNNLISIAQMQGLHKNMSSKGAFMLTLGASGIVFFSFFSHCIPLNLSFAQ